MSSIAAPSRIAVVDGDPSAIAHARDAARTFTEGLAPAPDPDAADTVVLVVSELVTNAHRHAGGQCTLILSAHPEAIEIAVCDHSPRLPRERVPDLNGGTGGFGWPMVRRLAHHVTITPGPGDGKTIHAYLPR
ncbi:ATP-binding protein [Streptomyces sp. NPDC004647]|uniref:ATP-binding protein n=1 Tax=Streptomyces sp. NPDC004647 TaxID=3154671 RepID=UPI0033B3BD12